MKDNYYLLFKYTFLLFIAGVLLSGTVLKLIISSDQNKFRFLNVRATKSKNQTHLLGGLALSITLICGIIFSNYFLEQYISLTEKKLLEMSLISILIVSVYGLIDDIYEVRARHKLFLQTFAIISFIYALNLNHTHFSIQYFLIELIIGFALINGMNLIDGIDGLLGKVGLTLSFFGLFLGVEASSIGVIILSIITISFLIMFLKFNNEPAKIYSGEIGGSLLGLIFFIQLNLIYEANTKLYSNQSVVEALTILAFFIYPILELGITFLRRILNSKSPFQGDHLHLHHIIKNKFNFNALKTSNLISSFLFTINFTLVIFKFSKQEKYIIIFSIASLITFYILTCYRHWHFKFNKSSQDDLFMGFYNKPILIVDAKKVENHFQSIDMRSKKDEIKSA